MITLAAFWRAGRCEGSALTPKLSGGFGVGVDVAGIGGAVGEDELVAVEAIDARRSHAGTAESGQVEGVLLEFVDGAGQRCFVDADDAAVHAAGNFQAFFLGSGEHACAQAVSRVVGEFDGLVDAVEGHDGQHRPEGLVGHDAHGVVDAAQYGGRIPGSAFFNGLAAAMHGGALLDSLVDVRLDGRQLFLEDQGADVSLVGRFGIGGYLRGQFSESRNQSVVQGAGDVDAFDRLAGLAGGCHRTAQEHLGGAFQVGRFQDDGGVFAAHFQECGNEVACRAFADQAAGPHAAGETDRVHVVDHRLPGRPGAHRVIDHVRESGNLGEALADGVRVPGRDLAGLVEDRAARNQSRNRVDHSEQEGEVPGRNDADNGEGNELRARIDGGYRTVAGGLVLDQLARETGHSVGHVPEVVDLDVGDQDPSRVRDQRVEDRLAVVLHGIGEGVQRLDPLFQAEVQPGGLVHAQAIGGRRHFVGGGGLDHVVAFAGAGVSYLYRGERCGCGHGRVSFRRE